MKSIGKRSVLNLEWVFEGGREPRIDTTELQMETFVDGDGDVYVENKTGTGHDRLDRISAPRDIRAAESLPQKLVWKTTLNAD